MEIKNKKNIDLAKMRVDFDGFKDLAQNKNLSKYEKIGFPDSYRKGFEEIIFKDILLKLTNLNKSKQAVLDIGSGCSQLPDLLINLCTNNNNTLVFCDSEEMLAFHNDIECLHKVAGMFPRTYDKVKEITNQYDVILCYSVLQYIFIDTNLFDFIDKCMSLLKSGGQFLIGDIPNISKRKRFFSCETGISYHKKFMNTSDNPKIEFNKIEEEKIDDSIIISIIMRAQAAGFDAYLIPQLHELPMSNRRDDILITKA